MPAKTTAAPFVSAASASVLLNAVRQAIVSVDPNGLVTFWNPYAEVIYGWPATEAIGTPFAEIDSARAEFGIVATLRSGNATGGPCVIRRRDGSSIRVWATGASFAGEDGRPAGVVGTMVALTGEREAPSSDDGTEEVIGAAFVGSPARHIETGEVINRTLFEHASDGFMLTDPAGRIAEVNGSWVQMFGYSRAEALALTLEDLIDATELANDPVHYNQVARSGSLIRRRRMKRKDGWIFPVEVNATWVSKRRVLTIVRDISDRVRADEELRASEAKYRNVVENAGDGIVIADRSGRVIDANRRAMEMIGYTLEEGKGKPLSDFLTAEETQARPLNMAEVIARGSLVQERTARRKDGSTLQVELSGAVSPDGTYIGFFRDLSERKKAERELKASEENYRRIVELSPDGIVVHVAGTVVYANEAAVRLLGFPDPGAMIGHSVLEYLDPAYRDRVVERIDRVMTHSLLAPLMEERLVRADGRTVDVETIGIPLTYEGKPAVQVVIRDITARKQAEEALRSSEERYRGIVEKATDAIYLVAEDGMLIDANPATLAMTGWSLDEILSKKVIDLIHPDDQPRAQEVFLSGLNEAQREPEVFRIVGPSGAYIYLEMMTTPVVQQSGARALFGIGRDITGARNAEKQIRFQASLLANVRNAVIASDENGVIIYWNRSAEMLYGWKAEEALGRSIEDVLEPEGESPLVAAGADLAASGRWEGEARIHARNGEKVHIHLVLATMVDETGSAAGVVGSSFDVTRLHEAERELEQAKRFSSLGRLAATVAHEFNNVMMGIYPFAEIIRKAGDPQLQRASVHVTQALQRGKQITQEILKFARASEPMLASVDVGQFLRGAVDELHTIGGSGVVIEVDVPDECYMMADANQMQQVLSNLVANGRDAMHGGGTISINVSHCGASGIKPRKRAAADMLRISVSDTGCGIPPSELPMIFEPMFTTKRSTGTGLGLAVVHQVLMRHGGEVMVESTAGVGTTFHLLLPRATAPAPAEVPRAPVLWHPTRLLLVEDDPHVAAGLVALLEIEGIEVTLATLGRDAVGKIESFKPDAVILDIGLPDMDGVRVFGDISARWPDLPVVFSTGHGDENLLEAALRRPRVGYLLKPYGVDDLLAELSRIT